jgi:hypothetical protein
MQSKAEIAVKHWLTEIVIGKNFCPFAQKPFHQDAIRYSTIASTASQEIIARFINEIDILNAHSEIETTLCIIDTKRLSFYEYLDLLDAANVYLEDKKLTGTYQIASFHPEYLFDGEAIDAPSHYTNRAPFPILHILREASLSQVLDNMTSEHNIPEDNITRANSLGIAFFEKHLQNAYDLSD